jgi:hypothetical protein
VVLEPSSSSTTIFDRRFFIKRFIPVCAWEREKRVLKLNMFKIVSSRLFCLFWNMMRLGGKLISTHIWRYGAAEMQTPFRKGLYDALRGMDVADPVS